MLTNEKVIFPHESINEWTVLRPFTASGLFAYRHVQAIDLLYFPDFGDSDMNKEQRREALDNFIIFQRPLTAIVIFLNVVALEDFIRDIGIRISNIQSLKNHFPEINKLNSIRQHQNPAKPSKQLDKDPAPLMDFEKLNDLFNKIIGVEPIKKSDYSRLYDLTIIRHCVAHNGSVIREIDIPRFQYYSVKADSIINPPVKFVKETCTFLYEAGRHFEEVIKTRLFAKIISTLDQDWPMSKPKILCELIELFNFFGKLPPSSKTILRTEKEKEVESAKNYKILMNLCFEELKAKFK